MWSFICIFAVFSPVWGTVIVPSLGRFSDIGFLYNEHERSFISISAFNKPHGNNSFHYVQTGDLRCEYKIIRTLEDKLNAIGVDVSTKLSLMFGSFDVTGAAAFAKEEKLESEFSHGVLRYRKMTVDESLNIQRKSVLSSLSLDSARAIGATHMVLGIKWGSDTAVSFKHDLSTTSSVSSLSADLKLTLKKLANSVSASASLKKVDTLESTTEEFEVKVYSDIDLPSVPQTVAQVQTMLQEIPNLIRMSNGGKGSPQYFELISLDELEIFQRQYQRKPINSKLPKPVKKAIELEIAESELLELLNESDLILQKLASLQGKIHTYSFILPDESVNDIENLYFQFNRFNSILIAKSAIFLNNARANYTQEDQNKFDLLKQEYNNHALTPSVVKLNITRFQPVLDKITDFLIFKSNDIQYLEKKYSTHHMVLKHSQAKIMFFFTRESWKRANIAAYNKITKWLIKQEGIKMIVDCDISVHRFNSCPKDSDLVIGNVMYVERYDGAQLDNNTDLCPTLQKAVYNSFFEFSKVLTCHCVNGNARDECIVDKMIE